MSDPHCKVMTHSVINNCRNVMTTVNVPGLMLVMKCSTLCTALDYCSKNTDT